MDVVTEKKEISQIVEAITLQRDIYHVMPGLNDEQELRAWCIDRALGVQIKGFEKSDISKAQREAELIQEYILDGVLAPETVVVDTTV
jgi:hypothetical protein